MVALVKRGAVWIGESKAWLVVFVAGFVADFARIGRGAVIWWRRGRGTGLWWCWFELWVIDLGTARVGN
jgi:hypothetical protein